MPPMMPFVHDALWFGFFAGVALFAWKAAERFDLRLAALDFRRPANRAAAVTSTWFTTTTAPRAHPTGNSAFDEWRDGEMARIEAHRQALEARLHAFEAFVDKLKRAQDRETFERFMAQFRGTPAGVGDAADQPDHRPG